MKNAIIGMTVLAPTLFLSGCYVTSTPNTYYNAGYTPTYASYGWGGGGYYNRGLGGWGGYRGVGWYGNRGAWGHHGGWGYAGRHGGVWRR